MRVARLRPRADRASGAGAGSWRAAMLPTFGKGTRQVRGAGGQSDARPGQHAARRRNAPAGRSEEHTSELQSLMRISYAVFCLKNKNQTQSIAVRTNKEADTTRQHTPSLQTHKPRPH